MPPNFGNIAMTFAEAVERIGNYVDDGHERAARVEQLAKMAGGHVSGDMTALGVAVWVFPDGSELELSVKARARQDGERGRTVGMR